MTNDAVLKIIEQAAKEEWKTLDLAEYELKELPREVSDLTDLEELILGRVGMIEPRIHTNKLTSLPPELENLKKLRTLDLSCNPFEEIPEVVMRLYNLESLTLLPFSRRLRIKVIPQTIIQLVNLKEFCLMGGEIREIPKKMFRLPALTILNLSGNKIKHIPEEILESKSLEQIYVTSNPIENIPLKIVEKGIDSIRAFFLSQKLSHYQDNNPLQVERSIEFPPEYWTAGNSILSYFSHILSIKYPNQNIKVKIEQEGLLLRMIIDTPEGTTETIEQAFNDYVMVISRKLPPESLLTDPFEVMALKTKLEITEMELRIGRENFATFKDDSRERINSLEIQINQFYSLFGKMIENLPHNPIYMNQFTNHHQNSNIANLANQINDHGQQNANHFNQNRDKNTDEILKIITSLRQISSQFPPQNQEDILIDLEDVETELQKPESDRNLPKLKKRLMALLTASTIIAAPVANLTDFTNNITDLAQKAGIGLLH